jgi:hypothetical protein
MERMTLSFPSVFDLHDFKKEVEPTHTEARVNQLTGHFSSKELEIATTVYKAELVKEMKE